MSVAHWFLCKNIWISHWPTLAKQTTLPHHQFTTRPLQSLCRRGGVHRVAHCDWLVCSQPTFLFMNLFLFYNQVFSRRISMMILDIFLICGIMNFIIIWNHTIKISIVDDQHLDQCPWLHGGLAASTWLANQISRYFLHRDQCCSLMRKVVHKKAKLLIFPLTANQCSEGREWPPEGEEQAVGGWPHEEGERDWPAAGFLPRSGVKVQCTSMNCYISCQNLIWFCPLLEVTMIVSRALTRKVLCFVFL